jgi:uncharacterized membrane protein YraQ (UPF0718 family)
MKTATVAGRQETMAPLRFLPELAFLVVLALVLLRPSFLAFSDVSPRLQSWTTIFVAIVVQATPFLVLGVVISGAIASAIPPGWLANALPKRSIASVPMAGLAGVALPGCECGSVPIAGRLVARGAHPPAAMAFLLSAPAINPVVLVATAVAFPGQPKIWVARFLASLLTAIAVGLIWSKVGRDEWYERARRRVLVGKSKWSTFTATVQHDFLHAGGFLIVGGITAASLQTIVPKGFLDALGGAGFLSVLALSALAFLLAICSEADAFVAASMHQFSMPARLAFMVVGPVVDIKLVSLQAGTFGRAFAMRFAPLTFVVAVSASILVGRALL